jgi:glutathione synthase/RimK-type ligase-like ATP-grasp enzyme
MKIYFYGEKVQKLPKLGLLYLDHVLRFFDKSNFKGWRDPIETVVYHWGNDKDRFVAEVKRKNIDVLIGNIPATAYETFREIARELPDVEFVPSLDAQFCNKSKENVTRFSRKYDISIPNTDIIYEEDLIEEFLEEAEYPRIIKRSYGPSNYGGYFVHKVDSKEEAKELLEKKKYYPLYTQDFVPMSADVRVMLVGHKPMCAFWRRPPEGEWLTNTSQGGSMDYQGITKEILDFAVNVSKSANAEYWACDIAVAKEDGSLSLLESATAFAAFPYIRDWIGQYLMWKFGGGLYSQPNIPLYNWEELGKMDSSVLRVLRNITFGEYTPSSDGEFFTGGKVADNGEFVRDCDYPMLNTDSEGKRVEEWASEIFNYQTNFKRNNMKQSDIEEFNQK